MPRMAPNLAAAQTEGVEADSGIEFVDQSPRDLHFFVVRGPLDLGQFTNLKVDGFARGDCRVRFAIIGESHYVSVRTPAGETVTEVCACTALRTDGFCRVEGDVRPVVGKDPLACRFDEFDYVCEFDYRSGGGDGDFSAFAAEAARLWRDPSGLVRMLHLCFPAADHAQPDPQTLVLVDFRNDLVVRSAHTYPPHDTIVFTRSRYTRRAG